MGPCGVCEAITEEVAVVLAEKYQLTVVATLDDMAGRGMSAQGRKMACNRV